MDIGYARTSTTDQQAGFAEQKRALTAAGCERLFEEQLSGANADRPQLQAMLAFMRKGDAVVVTKLDRLARSTRDLLNIVAEIERAGAALKVLDIALDSSTPVDRMMLTMVGAVATFEREIMLDRQRCGIEAAKAAKKYKGRAPVARRQAGEIRALKAQGLGATEIARRLGLARSSVYNVLAASAPALEASIP